MNFWERGENAYANNQANQTSYKSEDNAGGQADLRDKINEYAVKSQDELMQELLATANRMKGAGTLTARELDDFYNRVAGFLDEEQKARMRALIQMLKG